MPDPLPIKSYPAPRFEQIEPQRSPLAWQSALILWLVALSTALAVLLELAVLSELICWPRNLALVCAESLAISAFLGFIVWKLRAATPGAAIVGSLITANLMLATATTPWRPWQTGLIPLLTLFLMTYAATKLGRARKLKLGTAESKRGRNAAQIAANLGIASWVALVMSGAAFVEKYGMNTEHFSLFRKNSFQAVVLVLLISFAVPAADTISSEIGQLWSSTPRMITTWRKVKPGTDGAISFTGLLAGIIAAAVIAIIGLIVLIPGEPFWHSFLFISVFALIGQLLDSLFGATLERRGLLNNDAVNFLSIAIATVAAFSFIFYSQYG